VLVRGPARPVSRLRARESGDDAPRLHVLADEDAELARRRFGPRREFQRRVFLDVDVTHDLERVVSLDVGAAFDQIDLGARRNVDGRAFRNVDGVVLSQSLRSPVGAHAALAREADERHLAPLGVKVRVVEVAVEDDARVLQVAHRAVARGHRDVAALARRRLAEDELARVVGGSGHACLLVVRGCHHHIEAEIMKTSASPLSTRSFGKAG
jgi:hypothetical protein